MKEPKLSDVILAALCGLLLGMASIFFMAYIFGLGKNQAAEDCKTLGKFSNQGKVYECSANNLEPPK